MIVGGSQINALELAAAVKGHGHSVTILAPDGPLVTMAHELGLPYIKTIGTGEYPSIRTMRQLVGLARELSIDIVHAYEWRPGLEASFGPHLLRRVPVVITILSMYISRFLPSHIAQVVGTRELQASAAARRVHLMEPPIDTNRNCPCDGAHARSKWGIGPEELVVSVVCRLTPELEKLQGVLEAIKAIGELAERFPARLVVAGDGPGAKQVAEQAAFQCARLGRPVVLPLGQLLDPTDAYAAADVVIGMGSSVMRGMAFGKPVIVQGTQGFWQLLDERSVEVFKEKGWFGHGGGGAAALEAVLSQLFADLNARRRLGRFGRDLVVGTYSLDVATGNLLAIYERVLKEVVPASRWVASMAASAAKTAKFRAVMAYREGALRHQEAVAR